MTGQGTFDLTETGAAVAAVLDERAALQLKLDAAIRAARRYRDERDRLARDAANYSVQAARFAEALVDLGHVDIVNQALEESGDA